MDGGEPWTHAPGWVDYDGAVYGTGDLDDLGVKGAPDFEGPPLAPDDDLPPTNPDNERWIRDYFARRFPALADAPLKWSTTLPLRALPRLALHRRASTPSTRACGCSAAAPATASSTGRRWRSGWPPRCAGASRCPSASGSASARSGSRCAPRVPVADHRGTYRSDARPSSRPRLRPRLARRARRGAGEPDLPVARHPAAGRQRPRVQAGREPPVSGDPRPRHVRRHDRLVEHDRARARVEGLLRVGARLRPPRDRPDRHAPPTSSSRSSTWCGRRPARRRCR